MSVRYLIRSLAFLGSSAFVFFSVANIIIAPHAMAQSGQHKASARAPQIKPDMLTLRYKPQAGTLLYDIHTRISQRVRTDRDELEGVLRSEAQLAFHNVAIDYKKGLWSFDESFTSFEVSGHELSGDSLLLQENYAVNRVTELTYDMKGNELSKEVKDTLKLLNAEAQTNAYFFEPPRMLIPLPEHTVTYGNTWSEHRQDTIAVRDTINTGTTSGSYIYNVFRTYRLAQLTDTLERYLAVIVATDTGMFQGFQTNSVTKVMTKTSGPISGGDTTILDLFAGCVIKRTLDMRIPTQVEVSSAKPFTDVLTVHSIISLDESNAKELQNGQANDTTK
jgi:hypothetical protein